MYIHLDHLGDGLRPCLSRPTRATTKRLIVTPQIQKGRTLEDMRTQNPCKVYSFYIWRG